MHIGSVIHRFGCHRKRFSSSERAVNVVVSIHLVNPLPTIQPHAVSQRNTKHTQQVSSIHTHVVAFNPPPKDFANQPQLSAAVFTRLTFRQSFFLVVITFLVRESLGKALQSVAPRSDTAVAEAPVGPLQSFSSQRRRPTAAPTPTKFALLEQGFTVVQKDSL